MIPYGRQDISEDDIDAVVEVLRSEFITQGPVVPKFESAVAQYCGAGHAVAVSNATSALHVACRALNVGPGDVVWTSPNTFVASANCARYCGADVDFVDIDKDTFNISVQALADKLARARLDGERLPKVVIPVHFAGQSCEMADIKALSEEFDFRIVEDASHAIGGRYLKHLVGSCVHSDIAVFSFHPVKIITTGEGGMALTNDRSLAEKMSLLRSHGVTRLETQLVNTPDGPWYYEQVNLGFNYRMTEIQAALGLSQLKRVESFLLRRRELAERYDKLFDGTSVRSQTKTQKVESAHHLYVVRVMAEHHLGLFQFLLKEGIGVNLHYMPVYRQPYFRALGFPKGYCPASEAYYREAVSLPLFPTLTESQQDYIVDRLLNYVHR